MNNNKDALSVSAVWISIAFLLFWEHVLADADFTTIYKT